MPPLLTDFRATRPDHELAQTQTFEWLTEAHAAAEATRADLDESARAHFATRIGRALRRCACAPDKIGKRAAAIRDVAGVHWEQNTVYDLHRHPRGSSTATRMRVFAEIVDDYFVDAYPDDEPPPDDLVHVTCTGYISPSGAQKLVARRGWGAITRVTHAYHMGCYAAVPAVRIAAGYIATGSRRADIAHTELCSLHIDPSNHELEQLVVQTLFSDGLIRYSVVADDGQPGLRMLASHESVLADSAASMGWMVADRGMKMTLSRDVPERIATSLREFVVELYRRAGRRLETRGSVFAVHPGGPKILDRVRDVLELDEAQLRASRGVLFDHGNMSSATLPHVWMRVLADAAIPAGTLIPSLAFGPGLTVSGGLFEKR
jgi:predicted naringenin-chalcone synthase